MKVHGFIAIDKDGLPVLNAYGEVLIYKTAEDARIHLPCIGGKVYRVVTGKSACRRTTEQETSNDSAP